MNRPKVSRLLILLAIQVIAINATSVSYPGIGNFSVKDFYDPIFRPITLLPKSPEDIDPLFNLYTRRNRDKPYLLSFNDSSKFQQSPFDPASNTKFVVHGFTEDEPVWMNQIKDNYLKIENVNVIIVDWSKGARPPYSQAVPNCRVVGAMIGILIRNLVKHYRIQYDSFHIVGHSLGSHVGGYAGKFLEGKLGRITGLDPAGPFFESLNDTRSRLWHTDAKFVDSIHTDATRASIPFSGLGMYETCSHVDIYPNGGRYQNGCTKQRITSLVTEDFANSSRRLASCDHARSVDYFIESIVPNISMPVAYICEDYESFEQGKCADCGRDGSGCVILGPLAGDHRKFAKSTQGKRFFMMTADTEKYFRFQYLVSIKMGPKSNAGNGKVSLLFNGGNGRNHSLEFNDKNLGFNKGANHSRVVVLDIDPDSLEEITFKWSSGGVLGTGISLSSSTLQVDRLEVTALSHKSSSKKKNPELIEFRSDKDTFSSKEEVVFRRSGGRPQNNQDNDRRPSNNRPQNNEDNDRRPSNNNRPQNNQDNDRRPSNNRPQNNEDNDRRPSNNNRPQNNQDNDRRPSNNRPQNNQDNDRRPSNNRQQNNQDNDRRPSSSNRPQDNRDDDRRPSNNNRQQNNQDNDRRPSSSNRPQDNRDDDRRQNNIVQGNNQNNNRGQNSRPRDNDRANDAINSFTNQNRNNQNSLPLNNF